jgi:hypothetical protein
VGLIDACFAVDVDLEKYEENGPNIVESAANRRDFSGRHAFTLWCNGGSVRESTAL